MTELLLLKFQFSHGDSLHRRYSLYAFTARVFAYSLFYFDIMRIINILSAVTVKAAAQAHRLAPSFLLQELQIKASRGVHLTERIHRHVPFYAFLLYMATPRNATPSYSGSHMHSPASLTTQYDDQGTES
jgi:hypothetical protein